MVHRSGLALLWLLASMGIACDRGTAPAPEAAGPAERAPVEAAASDMALPSPTAAAPGNDAAAEALEIDRLAPDLYWAREPVMREVLLAFASGGWQVEAASGGIALHVQGAPRLAERLGLREGDLLTALDDLALGSGIDPRTVLERFASGERVRLTLSREGAARTLWLRVHARRASSRSRAEDLFAVARGEGAEPTLQRAILVALGEAAESLSADPGLVLDLLGLPATSREIAVDGLSIAPGELAAILGGRASAERVSIVAGDTSLTFRIVSGGVEAATVAEALRGAASIRPRRDPPGLLGSRDPGPGDPAEDPLADPVEGIERVDDTHVRLERSVLDAWMDDPGKLAKMARVVPVMESGVVAGMKLYGIRRGSPLGALGFENGDRVDAVNGHALTGPTAALEAYTKLRGARELEIEVLRRGRRVTLTIEIVGK